MIRFQGIRKVFRGRRGEEIAAVEDLDLDVRDGETLSLIGRSGCGKMTTMKLVNRLIEPTAGRILIDGRDIRDVSPIALRRRIGYVIQTGGLFPHMTVARNVGLICDLERWGREKIKDRVHELLTMVNLPPEKFATQYPRDLSGGERQRVGVARALALDPPYVLMDEPFGALDPITRDQLHEEFLQLANRVNKTIVLVTHDMAEAFKLADRTALMERGRLVQIGTEEDFRKRPAGPFVEEFLKKHLAGTAHA